MFSSVFVVPDFPDPSSPDAEVELIVLVVAGELGETTSGEEPPKRALGS